MFKKYTEYDPDMANRLLDEIGIAARDDEGFRLGPDGNKLTIVNFVNSDWPTESPEVAEMLKKLVGGDRDSNRRANRKPDSSGIRCTPATSMICRCGGLTTEAVRFRRQSTPMRSR